MPDRGADSPVAHRSKLFPLPQARDPPVRRQARSSVRPRRTSESGERPLGARSPRAAPASLRPLVGSPRVVRRATRGWCGAHGDARRRVSDAAAGGGAETRSPAGGRSCRVSSLLRSGRPCPAGGPAPAARCPPPPGARRAPNTGVRGARPHLPIPGEPLGALSRAPASPRDRGGSWWWCGGGGGVIKRAAPALPCPPRARNNDSSRPCTK